MSSSTAQDAINSILNPMLFQVVGSTPSSIRDSIKASNLKSNSGPATQLAATALFAAAVNKATMEGFIAKPELQSVRPVINSTFTVAGKPNMTGLTLLGHCILTTSFADNIGFCKEFRNKMGQNHLWAGNLQAGNLSDTQRKILQQKQSVADEKTSKLLGSGFLKYTGMVRATMTAEESEFWNENYTAPGSTGDLAADSNRAGGNPTFVPSPGNSPPRPRSSRATNTSVFTGSDGNNIEVPKDLADFYLANVPNGSERIVNSIERDGVQAWVDKYRKAISSNNPAAGFAGGSIVG